MSVTQTTFPALYKRELIEAIDRIPLDKVGEAIEIFRQARAAGRTIFSCGNGGSAATASHFVCDIVKGASYQRGERFKMMSLNDSLSTDGVLQRRSL